jgi:integrase
VPESTEAEVVICAWRPRAHSPAAASFAREVVSLAHPATPSHARSLLWCCAKLASFGDEIGLPAVAEVLLSPSVVERFVSNGLTRCSAVRLRSVRTNLRFVARRVVPKLWPPDPLALPRNRSKSAYSPAEIAAFLRLADAQPTIPRRQRLAGLICLGAGAGLSGADMRSVRGRDIVSRSGGLVVVTRGRVVPVLSGYHDRLVASALFAGAELVTGGVSESRKNVTSRLIASVAGGIDLPRLELGRLRATWLRTQACSLGLAALFAAGGFTHSQYLGDVVATISPPDEEQLVALLGGSHGRH